MASLRNPVVAAVVGLAVLAATMIYPAPQKAHAATYADFWTLVVGGGGGGQNNNNGGGGGAGGCVEDTTTSLDEGVSYTIDVGAGGAINTSGSNSTLGAVVTANGGGRGGPGTGTNGGSGGGGDGGSNTSGGTGSQGGNGGGGRGDPIYSGGGGGGCNANGQDGQSGVGGNGGDGDQSTISGASVYYGGGGPGGRSGGSNGSYGQGTKGRGGYGATNGGGEAGSAGVIIIRFPTDEIDVITSTNAVETTSGGDTILTWSVDGTFEFEIAASGSPSGSVMMMSQM